MEIFNLKTKKTFVALIAFEFMTTKFHEHEIPLYSFLARDVPCAGSMKRPILNKNCKGTTAKTENILMQRKMWRNGHKFWENKGKENEVHEKWKKLKFAGATGNGNFPHSLETTQTRATDLKTVFSSHNQAFNSTFHDDVISIYLHHHTVVARPSWVAIEEDSGNKKINVALTYDQKNEI